MTQRWRRLGQVLEPSAVGGWWLSHASYPSALARDDGLVNVYFSVRDSQNRSSVTRATLDISAHGFAVVETANRPLLMPGERGAFDADGVTAGCVIRHGERLFLYYLGWTVGGSVPFTNFIGLAIAEPGASAFVRHKNVPVVGRSEVNPLTVGYPWVLPAPTGGFQMWYGSHLVWGAEGLQMEHVIKSASSADGLTWTAEASIAVPLLGKADAAEFAVSRPTVLREADGTLSMWYARRRPHYEIGFATSADGVTWQRQDAAVGFVGKVGEWETREQTYPCVFEHRGSRYMLYNGDGYGRTGFGLAVLEQ